MIKVKNYFRESMEKKRYKNSQWLHKLSFKDLMRLMHISNDLDVLVAAELYERSKNNKKNL